MLMFDVGRYKNGDREGQTTSPLKKGIPVIDCKESVKLMMNFNLGRYKNGDSYLVD